MEILKELDQLESNVLKEQHKEHYLYETHIKIVLGAPHCYVVNIFAQDCDEIFIRSGPIAAKGFQLFYSLSAAVKFIKENQVFLTTTCLGAGFLDGQRVKHYLDRLNNCRENLPDCFAALDKYSCFMIDRETIPNSPGKEITDGMHRLVAYGLATDLNTNHFPISIYFGTDKALLPIATK